MEGAVAHRMEMPVSLYRGYRPSASFESAPVLVG